MSLRLTEEQFLALSGKKKTSDKNIIITNGYRSKVQGLTLVGDKEIYFKSLWEMNYARYLQFLKDKKAIHDWEYEPKTFEFPKEPYKTGPFSYKPDFKVSITKDKYEWHEVKGFLNDASKKKIRRFRTHFSKEEGEIVIIGKEWFFKMGHTYSTLIPGWETVNQAISRTAK